MILVNRVLNETLVLQNNKIVLLENIKSRNSR